MYAVLNILALQEGDGKSALDDCPYEERHLWIETPLPEPGELMVMNAEFFGRVRGRAYHVRNKGRFPYKTEGGKHVRPLMVDILIDSQAIKRRGLVE